MYARPCNHIISMTNYQIYYNTQSKQTLAFYGQMQGKRTKKDIKYLVMQRIKNTCIR